MLKTLLELLLKGAAKGAAAEVMSGKVAKEVLSSKELALRATKQVGVAAVKGAIVYGLPGGLMLLGVSSLVSTECVQQIGSLVGSLLTN